MKRLIYLLAFALPTLVVMPFMPGCSAGSDWAYVTLNLSEFKCTDYRIVKPEPLINHPGYNPTKPDIVCDQYTRVEPKPAPTRGD